MLESQKEKQGQSSPTATPEGTREEDGVKWTSEKPKEPGWYWWRRPMFADTEVSIIVVDLFMLGKELYVDRYGELKRLDGQWSGPIIPPPEPQEA